MRPMDPAWSIHGSMEVKICSEWVDLDLKGKRSTFYEYVSFINAKVVDHENGVWTTGIVQ